MKCLITGGTGFLGSHLAHNLLVGGHKVTIPTTGIRQTTSLQMLGARGSTANHFVNLVEGDIRDWDFLRKLFNEYEFTHVFHLAAISEVRKCQSDARLAYQVNVEGTVNVLEICRLYGSKIEGIAVSSSDKAYGEMEGEEYFESDPLRGKGIYENTKSCADMIARAYHKNFGLPVFVTRCCNLYGPCDANMSRLIPNVISRILDREKPILYSGMAEAIREFIYVEDAVAAYRYLMQNIDKTQGRAFNVGTGDRYLIKGVVSEIFELMGVDYGVVQPESGFPEIPIQKLNSSLLRSLTGWIPIVEFRDGLQKTIDFYKQWNSK